MNKKSKIIVFASLALLLLFIIFFPGIKRLFSPAEDATVAAMAGGGQQRRMPLNVNAMVLKHEKLTDVFRTKGQLLPDEEVDLSFETSGKIVKIYFREGSYVRQGELLGKVNDEPLQAELRKLETQLPLAQERVNRQRALLARDAVSQETFQTVTTDLDKLYADIELIKARIRQTELRAPFDGVVGLRLLSEGAFASTGSVLARLTRYSPLKIEFSVNERQVNDIRPGTPIRFRLDNDFNEYHAKVYALESTLDQRTLSLKARALYDNPGGRLRPGHSATIEIVLREIDDAIVIPAISSIAEMGRDIAYVYRNGRAKQVELTKGLRTASSVQITRGLQVGDTLLVTGVMQLRDGSEVVIDNFVENQH